MRVETEQKLNAANCAQEHIIRALESNTQALTDSRIDITTLPSLLASADTLMFTVNAMYEEAFEMLAQDIQALKRKAAGDGV
jgi:uncharacterized protein (DUF342 family)